MKKFWIAYPAWWRLGESLGKETLLPSQAASGEGIISYTNTPALGCQAFSLHFPTLLLLFFDFGISLHNIITGLKAVQKSGHPAVPKCLHTQEFSDKADQGS